MNQKRRDVYRDKNGAVCYTKSFICKSILELMNSKLKRQIDQRHNITDPRYFYPSFIYNDLSDYFEAFYGKRPDKNTFYLCINLLENQRKIKRVKVKKTLYYKLM